MIRPAALLLPVLVLNLGTFVWPMLSLAALSFRPALPGGAIGEGYGLETWAGVVGDSYYLDLLLHSVLLALGVTLLTLLASYPVAMFVHRSSGRWRNFLIVLCISPLLISAVVRTYGWLVILGDRGLVPGLLRGAGIVPGRLVFNETGVVIGLTEILMPYMILALLAGFGRLDGALEDAAASLGAAPWTRFRRILLPLTLPGIMLGCLLAFVLAVSSFITPKLLGGGRVSLLATEIYDQAIVTLNWPVAAALSMVVLGVFGLALLAYGRVLRAVT